MEKIRTNHMIVEFLWKEFLEDYDFFKIEYGNVDFDNITSIYCKLEGLYPNSAICAFNKMAKNTQPGESSKHRIFLFASSKKEKLTMALLQECLKNVNVKIKQITYRPAYDEGIYTNNMLNLLLSMIPNRNKALSYAHGKLICGTCSSIYNKGRSAGEELGLHISFDYDNLLTARTLTFAEEDKIKKKNKKDSLVYHLEFDEKRIYFSSKKKKGTKEYYNHPSVFRKDNKNHIPFLGFGDIEHFEESQAYLIRSVLQDFLTTYSKYVSVNPIEYKKPTLLKAQDAEFRKEDELLRDMLSTSWIEIACHTTETGVEKLRNLIEQKSREYIKKLFGNSFEGYHEKDKSRKQICIRIVGDKDQEEKLSDSERQTLDYRRLKEKMELIEKKIPTQDVMIKSEIEAATIKNIFRQILIKDYCIKGALPQYMIDRFKGCVITYAERKTNSSLYYFIQLTIDKDGSIAYKVEEPRLPHDNVITVMGESFESHEYHIPAFNKGYNKDFIYCIEKDGITYNIYDTCEFVFPEMEEIHRALVELKNVQVPVEVYNGLMDMVQSNESKALCRRRINEYADTVHHGLLYADIRKLGKEAPKEEKLTLKLMRFVTSKYNIKKGQDFRTASRSEETLAACVNVHYWKQDTKLWKYCAGPNTKGNFHSINHKVYVRELLSDITPNEAFVNELIYSLGDGWNKINEFSVHPSIFKFLKEHLEVYKAQEQLNELTKKVK